MSKLTSEEMKAICEAGREMREHIESAYGEQEMRILIYQLMQLDKINNLHKHMDFFLDMYIRYHLGIPKVFAKCLLDVLDDDEKAISVELVFKMSLVGVEYEE